MSDFNVDLALAGGLLVVEWVNADRPLTGNQLADATPKIAVLPIAVQLADKTCALFERHGKDLQYSSRVRDLADIGMIATQIDDISGDELHAAIRAEEAHRLMAGTLTDPLPSALVLEADQAADWTKRWSRATRDAPITFTEAREQAGLLLDPVLADRVRGHRWSRDRQAWVVASEEGGPS